MDDFNLDTWLEEDEKSQAVEPAKPTLSSSAIRILSFCEQTFWVTGLLPTAESVSSELEINVATVRKAYKDEVFTQALASKGIDPSSLVVPGQIIKESKALSPQQILCANMMLNLHDKRSEREKLALIGISSQQYHAWLRQPQFQEFLRKRGEALFSSSDYKAYKSLVRNVEAGDNKSLELFFRMRGIYKPQLDININIEAVLTRVIEVISTHVKDPKVLSAIANEIDAVIEAEEVA